MYYFHQVPSLFLRSYTLKAARPFGGFLDMPYERSLKLSKDQVENRFQLVNYLIINDKELFED